MQTLLSLNVTLQALVAANKAKITATLLQAAAECNTWVHQISPHNVTAVMVLTEEVMDTTAAIQKLLIPPTPPTPTPPPASNGKK